jgi:hypothetical protein
MRNTLNKLGVLLGLVLATSASASTVYVAMEEVGVGPPPVPETAAFDSVPWEIGEGPNDYAPRIHADPRPVGGAPVEFAVMEPSGVPDRELFLNPQD